MLTIFPQRIIAILLAATFLSACEVHKRTIREYDTDRSGRTAVHNVTEEQYWKERVNERIAAEIAKQKPEAGYATWQDYWRWWYGVLRKQKKPPFKSDSLKTSEDMVNYIKDQRRAKGLPTYDE